VVVVRMNVRWSGGLIGTGYHTNVDWAFSKTGQEGIEVVSDDSPVQPTESAKQRLRKQLEQFYGDLKIRMEQ